MAEVLAGRLDGVKTLRTLAADRDPAVRAAAVWSLGSAGGAADGTALAARLDDQDLAVAANAAGALGRLSRRTGVAIAPWLCPVLTHPWKGVRANALAALALARASCDLAVVVELLARDESAAVRSAAARFLAGSSDKAAVAALVRCADEDESARVATACAEPVPPSSGREEGVLVVVVPTGESEPVPRAPFALRFADGTHRLGVADRRGALFERRAPAGSLELLPLTSANE